MIALEIVIALTIAILVISIGVFGYIFGRTHQRENIKKAWIFVDNGQQVDKPLKGSLVYTSNTGYKYEYYLHNKLRFLRVPMSYPIKYHKSRRILWTDTNGGTIALPFANNKELATSDKEDLIFELTTSELLAQAIRAMKGKASMGIIIIVAIVALLIGGVGVYFMTNKSKQQVMPASTNTTIQSQNTQSINVGGKK